MFLVTGEPGIGKTRLCRELATEAEAQGTQVLWGRCWEGGGAPPFWPWAQILRTLIRNHPLETVAAQLGAGGAEIARIVPDMLPIFPASPGTETGEDGAARFHLFVALTEFLKTQAMMQPLLLLLDDAHAADVPSLLLLQFLARELADARVLILVALRESETQRSHVAALIGELGRESRRIPLRGLSASEVGLLAQRAFRRAHPATAGATPSTALIDAVHQASGGNIFFADALLRAIEAERRWDAPTVVFEGQRVPDQVRDAVRLRHLRPLGAHARDVLATAAVVGREFDSGVVACVHGSVAFIESALGEAVAAGLVIERDRHRSRYEFRHSVVRAALYEDLQPSRRAALHRAVGEAFETLYSADMSPYLSEIAHHFARAARGAEARRAVLHSERAERRASELLEYRDAPLDDSSVIGAGRDAEASFSRIDLPRPTADEAAAYVWRKGGDFWTIAYQGREIRLRDSNGLFYIGELLRHPARELHVADLNALAAGQYGQAELGSSVLLERDVGEVLDSQATAAYRQRLRDLDDELESAMADSNLGCADRIRQEIEIITHELTAAYGLCGRARRAGDPAERLRKAVTNQIRRALARVRDVHPGLERHLQNAIRTGILCSYKPDSPIGWMF